MLTRVEVKIEIKGYLQRVNSQDCEDFWQGDVKRESIESVRDNIDGRKSTKLSGAGERTGTAAGVDQGDNARVARPVFPHNHLRALILISLTMQGCKLLAI